MDNQGPISKESLIKNHQDLMKLKALVEQIVQDYYNNIKQAKAIESGQLLRSSKDYDIDVKGEHFLVTLYLPEQWAFVEYGYRKRISLSVKKQAPRHWKSTVPQTATQVLPRPLLENAIKNNAPEILDIQNVIFNLLVADIDSELEKNK